MVKLRFEYTFSDWIRAVRFYRRFTRGFYVDKLVAIFAFAMGCFSLWTSYIPSFNTFAFFSFRDWFLPIFLFVASVAIWFDLATWLGWKVRFWRKKNNDSKWHEFLFDDFGAEFKIGEPTTVQVRLAWDEFQRVRENKYVILLIPKNGSFWAIPKRYLVDSSQLNVFQNLITQKIP